MDYPIAINCPLEINETSTIIVNIVTTISNNIIVNSAILSITKAIITWWYILLSSYITILIFYNISKFINKIYQMMNQSRTLNWISDNNVSYLWLRIVEWLPSGLYFIEDSRTIRKTILITMIFFLLPRSLILDSRSHLILWSWGNSSLITKINCQTKNLCIYYV